MQVWSGGLLLSVCSRFKGPAWILVYMLVVSLGRQESKNAEFGQVARPLEAVQIPVLLNAVLDFWRWSVSLVHVMGPAGI